MYEPLYCRVHVAIFPWCILLIIESCLIHIHVHVSTNEQSKSTFTIGMIQSKGRVTIPMKPIYAHSEINH